jgi:hypothetical protein
MCNNNRIIPIDVIKKSHYELVCEVAKVVDDIFNEMERGKIDSKQAYDQLKAELITLQEFEKEKNPYTISIFLKSDSESAVENFKESIFENAEYMINNDNDLDASIELIDIEYRKDNKED